MEVQLTQPSGKVIRSIRSETVSEPVPVLDPEPEPVKLAVSSCPSSRTQTREGGCVAARARPEPTR